ncbi:hypothetical protein GGS26DRAFT_571664 [Hypomontagnella submonticulosa]|nr:hypothetical protein GGS26DRAFT_571664 [Hypomontagnella submonticulosa]
MASTSKSTTSSSKSAPTGNPAPDFTVNMNRIQTQLEARLKAARSFLPSRSDLINTSSSSGSGSFSALSGSSNPSSARDAAARRQAEEAEFAEERGLDPNAGIGSGPARSGGKGGENENGSKGQDRETSRLRGRLLGKRGRGGAADSEGQKKWVRREDSSDEEAGRSGLGRAKRVGKRSRAEMEGGDGERQDGGDRIQPDAPPMFEVPNKTDSDERVDCRDDSQGGAENLAIQPTGEEEPGQPVVEGGAKKRRKKKKKKNSKNKVGEE